MDTKCNLIIDFNLGGKHEKTFHDESPAIPKSRTHGAYGVAFPNA
jgi:hypothetical protein